MHYLKLSLLKAQVFLAFWITFLLKPEALLERLIEEERIAKRELARKNTALLKLGVRIRACSVPPARRSIDLPRLLKCRQLVEEIEITRKAILVAEAALNIPELLNLLVESGDAVRLTEVP